MIIVLCLSFVAMALFCFAMAKHRAQVFSHELNKSLVTTFRLLAWLLLLLTFAISIDLYAWSIGPVVFIGALGAALLVLILLLTYHARLLPKITSALFLLAGVQLWWLITK